jgi:hypothetical protein
MVLAEYCKDSWLFTQLFPDLKYIYLDWLDKKLYRSSILEREPGLEVIQCN